MSTTPVTTTPLLVEEGESRAVLAFGSNLGDRGEYLDAAIAEVAAHERIRMLAVSDYVQSVAVTLHGEDESAPSYLNAVAIVATTLDAHALLAAAHEIEDRHGRVRTQRWGDRTLDIDIISYDDVVLSDADLILPHPRAAERSFVIVPWLSIDPDAALPGIGRVDDLDAALRQAQGPALRQAQGPAPQGPDGGAA
jgi:2-amino-4-hydroxy-6-hydroxymethyldihydropteridine diphosphokinase